MTTSSITSAKTQEIEKYRQRLWDPQWLALRKKILKRDGFACRCCGKEEGLHVHHRQYHRDKKTGEWKKPWDYEEIYLITVCDKCHKEGHRLYPVPIKDI
ncbi:hypothetical protein BC751_2748 [Cecembia calidifontis]|uniref:HNH endonuclease n=1 Tax=Cecembia calidifontis TaxID=1187080 RepID=A0A4Q7PAC5_9BACT|nr:hypothetical protein BC751_2748 [Cecembia calidifontis]